MRKRRVHNSPQLSLFTSELSLSHNEQQPLGFGRNKGSVDLFSSRSIGKCRRARRSAAADLSNNRSNVVRRALHSSARKAVVSCIKQHRATSAAKRAALPKAIADLARSQSSWLRSTGCLAPCLQTVAVAVHTLARAAQYQIMRLDHVSTVRETIESLGTLPNLFKGAENQRPKQEVLAV
ncbi:hypothetical protein ACLKA7_001248 [Drosophila subpalustris]